MCLILFCSVMEGDMYRIAGIEFDHVVQILRSSAATRSSWLRLELQILVRWNRHQACAQYFKLTCCTSWRGASWPPRAGSPWGCCRSCIPSTDPSSSTDWPGADPKRDTFFFPCFEMNNALTFYMKTPNERRATSLGKKDDASCRVQGVKRNTEITVAVVLRMRLQLFLVFDWVTYKLRDLTVCSLGYYTMLLIQPRFLLHGAEVIGFSLFELWL